MTQIGGETFVMIARIPAQGVALFRQYEERVLPLLEEAGGKLRRRLRNADGTIEVHVVWFPSTEVRERYRSDARRAAQAALLEQSQAVIELLALSDV